ncbi:molybdate ABC transporter substrate-binding protein [Paenibacillus selenitireducens]|uniref:Molybdate ABC transporter substrate-binding protein n=1 Tax=Paenibacillus selenitireducens TaxID=1324314 RepID=A0A1T2XMU1_9BACL|nr:molybdate ABC transporter substrate-binding protein [Paenibacillus selenitireducens]OPA81189.1 molybdate ABC transporter substrate-binding protein [Paenibacillus selenitireducens]
MLKKMLSILLVMVALTGCASKEQASSTNGTENKPSAQKVELLISAAASLTDSLNEIKTAYQQEHNNIELTFNLAASGTLQKQIEQGAPADLFLSAGKKQMTALVDKQLIEQDQQVNLLTNELVMVVPKDSNLAIQNIKDITSSNVKKIAVGEPESVPVGNYTKESLTFYQLWDTIQAKTVFAKDVKQVLHYVESGNTEVGFVYKTDALTSQKVTVALTLEPDSHKAIEYPVGIVKATKHPQEADEFYKYLQSKAAQDIFIKYGFSIPNQ